MDKSFIKKVRLKDRIATRVITVGGLIVIASVIAILVLIVKVTLPLFLPAKAKVIHTFQAAEPANKIIALGIDDYQEVGFRLDQKGNFSFFSMADGHPVAEVSVAGPARSEIKSVDNYKSSLYNIVWNDLSTSVVKADFKPVFDKSGKRTITPQVETLDTYPPDQYPAKPLQIKFRQSEEGRNTKVALLPDNTFLVKNQVVTTDLFDNKTVEAFSFPIAEKIPGTISVFTLNNAGTILYAGTDTGNLLSWDLSENDTYKRLDNVVAVASHKPVTALTMVYGDVSLAVGDAEGHLTTWMRVRTAENSNTRKLRKIHTLQSHDSAITSIEPSRRNKTLISRSADGSVHFDHMTSENHLLTLKQPLSIFAVANRGNSLIGLNKNDKILLWDIHDPHPEINFKTLFGKVWYESYDEPKYVWQSSAGSDDFEAKYSIIPLLFGTIKGTLYAMLFAIPLAIFGAVYTSQFTNHFFKKSIKPAIEIMASVPSVVIGFLIALWLAPIVQRNILGVLISVFLIPLVFLLFMFLFQPFFKNNRIRELSKGYEFLAVVPVIILAGAISAYLGPRIEALLFDGNFTLWLFHDLGMRYDQRNCIIIAFGLGIAVIPIIFSITEDAISNIPPSLTAASLALGASRWQTVWRVVLPSASPGIFAAIMIGFGRAVGETMIVLMATGNTPIMDWSIFNGMRTLSANIAVEIPEAPFGGTLYRVLFLCATLLFILTFILNTAAETIRERLRKKYGRY